MTRIVYISGRYRHYNGDGSLNRELMDLEIEGERRWAELIARCGMAWIAPLHNTAMLEAAAPIKDDEYIERDCVIIRLLRVGYDLILMRAGWDREPISVGATRENEVAVKRGLIVVHGEQGTEKVFEYLRGLKEGE